MLSIRELEAQAKALVPVVREYVKGMFEPLSKRLESAENRLKAVEAIELPTVDEQAIAEKAAALIVVPTPENGKDVDPEELKGVIGECIAEFDRINGREGLGADEARELIEKLVAELPKPQDGKDADPEVIKRQVEEAVAQIPAPKDGESVSIEDIKPVIADRVAAAVAELPKPADGKSVPIEEVERMVDAAVAKAMQSIVMPKDGAPGEDGRDAADLEILPEIDESKSYARGTFATHANGLWRAYERTHGMKGWECIVAGVAGLEVIEGDDLRQISVKTMLSNGIEQIKTFHFPAMVYRGVFKSGMYAPGDTVTWGGSLWHCDEPTEDKPGEVNSKGWTLAAKRGNHGKDGRNGIDKTAPVKLS